MAEQIPVAVRSQSRFRARYIEENISFSGTATLTGNEVLLTGDTAIEWAGLKKFSLSIKRSEITGVDLGKRPLYSWLVVRTEKLTVEIFFLTDLDWPFLNAGLTASWLKDLWVENVGIATSLVKIEPRPKREPKEIELAAALLFGSFALLALTVAMAVSGSPITIVLLSAASSIGIGYLGWRHLR